MNIEISPRAEADIRAQFLYYLVDQDAPAVAFRFREAAIGSIERLSLHPRIGTLFRGPVSHLRSWPVSAFPSIRIYYLELPDSLRIIRVLHGSRDVRRILTRV